MIPKVVIVDDHTLVRAGIRKLLDESSDVEVIADFASAQQALALCEQQKPDIVLTDVDMPGLSGIEFARKIATDYARISVIMLTMHRSQQYVIESLRAGAKGYVMKDSALAELLTAIKTVIAGNRFLSSALTEEAVAECVRRGTGEGPTNDLDKLSEREREILKLLTEGNTSKQIRAALFISESTVDAHRWNIMKKLNIHSMAGLTRFAIANGLTSAN